MEVQVFWDHVVQQVVRVTRGIHALVISVVQAIHQFVLTLKKVAVQILQRQ